MSASAAKAARDAGTSGSPRLEGSVAEGFEGVREEFAAVLRAEAEGLGAQLAVFVDGRLVVDLAGGADMRRDSLTGVFSATKGAAHLVVALLVQAGELDLDRRVVDYWPEFGAQGKDELSLRGLLAHQAGSIGVPGGFTPHELADDARLAERLAPAAPYWRPGSAYGYHAFVIGALTGEVVRRATGATTAQVFSELVGRPFEVDVHLGLPDELEARYVPVEPATSPSRSGAAAPPPPRPDGHSLLGVAFNLHAPEPTDLVAFANSRQVRALGQTSLGGVASARGLATMYAAAITGVGGRPALLRPRSVAELGVVQARGTDLVTGERDHFTLGFETAGVRYPVLGAGAFGHSGAAGTEAFAAPDHGIAYAYTRRRFGAVGGAAPENSRLTAAVVEAVLGTSAGR